MPWLHAYAVTWLNQYVELSSMCSPITSWSGFSLILPDQGGALPMGRYGDGGWIERGEHSLCLRIWDCTTGKELRRLPPLPDGSSD